MFEKESELVGQDVPLWWLMGLLQEVEDGGTVCCEYEIACISGVIQLCGNVRLVAMGESKEGQPLGKGKGATAVISPLPGFYNGPLTFPAFPNLIFQNNEGASTL